MFFFGFPNSIHRTNGETAKYSHPGGSNACQESRGSAVTLPKTLREFVKKDQRVSRNEMCPLQPLNLFYLNTTFPIQKQQLLPTSCSPTNTQPARQRCQEES